VHFKLRPITTAGFRRSHDPGRQSPRDLKALPPAGNNFGSLNRSPRTIMAQATLRAVLARISDDSHGAGDEQPAQMSIALLRDPAKSLRLRPDENVFQSPTWATRAVATIGPATHWPCAPPRPYQQSAISFSRIEA
jgi:hypothetical protein